ncbi:MAG: hypothetical protein HDR05_07125 [Lachnospiraceae bacterium]|nr:hypothetical protein [Lachnospiraceae bacterium]
METFYLVDFENVHDEGLENIGSLSQTDHVHIFSTKNAPKIRMDIEHIKEVEIEGHLVPACKQSVDMHLVSYLGYLLCSHGKQCAYVIVSKDKDYDNIIEFWKKEGYSNTSRKPKIPGASVKQKKTVQKTAAVATTQTVNSKISAGMDYIFSGDDRSELNLFMQRGLAAKGYSHKHTNRICMYVVAHCNDERVLSGIHNDLREEYDDYLEVYEDVKAILEKFVSSKSKIAKRESQVRSFFGQHFRKKIYTDNKEEIIGIILNAETKQQINNELMKLYGDGSVVKHIYQTIQPLIKELPGK